MHKPCTDPPQIEYSIALNELTETIARDYSDRVHDSEENPFPTWAGQQYRSDSGTQFHDTTTVRSSVCMPYGEWSGIEDSQGEWCARG